MSSVKSSVLVKKNSKEEKEWIIDHANHLEYNTQDEYAELMGIGSSTLQSYKLKQKQGALEDKPPVPKNIQAIELEIVAAILKTHFTFPTWGGEKLSDFLLNKRIAYASPGTAQKVKNKAKKLLTHTAYELSLITRYEALVPNKMWALDFLEFKWYGKKIYIAVLLDDHSRYVLSWRVSTSPTTKLVLDMVDEACKEYGTPVVVKSDNGPQFRNKFRTGLNERGIFHLNSPAFRPSFNGKVERLNSYIRNVVDDIKELPLVKVIAGLETAIHDYNFVRPNQALGGITPHVRLTGKEDEVMAQRLDFKHKELYRRGLQHLGTVHNQNTPKGNIVSICRDGEHVLSVKSFIEIHLYKVLD